MPAASSKQVCGQRLQKPRGNRSFFISDTYVLLFRFRFIRAISLLMEVRQYAPLQILPEYIEDVPLTKAKITLHLFSVYFASHLVLVTLRQAF